MEENAAPTAAATDGKIHPPHRPVDRQREEDHQQIADQIQHREQAHALEHQMMQRDDRRCGRFW